MSEQKQSSFMEELDQWTESTIIGQLLVSETNPAAWEGTTDKIKMAIRTKVLESYHNGQQAGQRTAKQPQKGGR